jgi:tripartite tricarboxylate transporter family receptor
MFKAMAGVNMVHVPYRGEPPAITDMLAGQVQVMFGNVTASIAHIRSGTLRARRLLALAAVLDGVSREEAAKPSFVFLAKPRRCDAPKSRRNGIGADMTNLLRSPC